MTTHLSSPGKDLLLSKTFWGIVVALLGSLLARYGWTIENPETVVNHILSVLDLILQLVGFVVAIWGNIIRKEKITRVMGVRLK